MNYISHIHLASHTQTSLAGAFLGDFVKGSDLSLYTEPERLGILLHRKIDSFTDQHDALSEIKALFPDTIRRYSGIALDIYFDHLLMCKWPQFSSVGHASLFDCFYQELKQTNYGSNIRYTRVKQALIREQWLSNYEKEIVCLKAMQSIENRFKHPAVFAQEAFIVLQRNRKLVEKCFDAFYPDLMRTSEGLSSVLKDRLLTDK